MVDYLLIGLIYSVLLLNKHGQSKLAIPRRSSARHCLLDSVSQKLFFAGRLTFTSFQHQLQL